MKKRYDKIILYILMIITVLLAVGLLFTSMQSREKVSKEEINKRETLEKYDYIFPNNPVKSQMLAYDELINALATEVVVEQDYAKAIAKVFVTDFFTWTNKEGRYDIGGVEYITSGFGANFKYAAVNSFYYNLPTYVKEFGKNNLLEVDFVEILSVTEAEFIKTNGEAYDKSYIVHMKWTYVINEIFDNSKFQTTTHLTMVKDDDGKYKVAYFLRD